MILRYAHGLFGRTWHRTWTFLLWMTVLSALQSQADFEETRSAHYVWKTGPWRLCKGEECGSGGVQSRTVWCIHTEGWTAHHSNCNPEDRPLENRDCFKVCDWHHKLFEWQTSEWENCVLAPSAFNNGKPRTFECVTAQHGLQHRKVHCVQTLNKTVVADEICEFFTARPVTEQACLIPCPHDCVVSEFSEWSICSKSCSKGLQYRTRAVVAPPLYGGSDCPNFSETRFCNSHISCPVMDDTYKYSLKVGPWSECRLPHDKDVKLSGRTMLDFSTNSAERSLFKYNSHHSKPWNVDIGYQTRKIRCVRNDGKNTLLSLCVQDSVPVIFQSCVMPQDCDLSDWTAWSTCSKTCHSGDLSLGIRSRTRSIKHIAIGGGKECPELEEKEACNLGGEFLPPCPRYTWKVSEWKSCQVMPLLGQQDRRWSNQSILCGGGIQMRHVYCAHTLSETETNKLREAFRPVERSFCTGPMPPSFQICTIPCPTECLVSAWAAWGPCVHENCQDPQGRRGFKMRTRQVVIEPSGTADQCPHLIESIPCEDPVCYRWHILEKGPCERNSAECGRGSRFQKGVCRDERGVAVSSAHCSADIPPEHISCDIPCPMDCVLSEWSEWSVCSHSCSSRNVEGKQTRTRWILAPHGEGGKPCPFSQYLQEWQLCNNHPCTVYYWETTPWSPCILDTSVNTLNATMNWNGDSACAVGIQTRKVICKKLSTGQVTTKRCPDSTRPEIVRPCLLSCKKDCIVTPFSEWTPCPTSCYKENVTSVKQSRYRIINQYPALGGQECPDTLYEERECENVAICPTYSWKSQKWQQCTLVPESVRQGSVGVSEACGYGLQSRDITCHADDDQPADLNECLKWAGTMPPLVQECHIPCKDDCTFSLWSKFSLCTSDCGATRSRRRFPTGRSKKREKCQNTELYPQIENDTCPCTKYMSLPYGNWSDCILSDERTELQLGSTLPADIRDCGQGLRFKAVACYDQTGKLVGHSFCSSNGYIAEICTKPCPFDCKLSDWSSWSGCSVSCGSGVKIRSRWLREKPYNGGRRCPKLDLKNQVYEAVPCYSECSQYTWKPDSWSSCKVNSEDNSVFCGTGTQSRKVQCINSTSDGLEEPADDSLCDIEAMPVETQKCIFPCPNKCVMSEWSQWSKCPQKCNSNSVRKRTRHPLRFSQSGNSCPADSQEEPCILNKNCFHFHYNLTDWSTCQLSENAVCGQGIRTRLLECVRSDGKSVNMAFCEQLNLEKSWRMNIHCLVECPIDCHLTEWSAWSECSQSCGLGGHMTHSRHVVLEAQGEGRPCPLQNTQYKPCPIKPCYSWVLGKWSSCTVEGGQCGEGSRVRNLSCFAHDGTFSDAAKLVDDSFCENKASSSKDQDLRQACFVPCPGDCHLTEWSSWSSCHLTCIDQRSFESTGRQSRSKAVIMQSLENQSDCPEQIFETRPCSGSCSFQTQPSATRHCNPSCTKPFSYCTQNGVCGCESGYTEVMTSNGFLDYCSKLPGPEEKKGDVKKVVEKSKPDNSKLHDFFRGWSIQPFAADGGLKGWVYGVSIGGFAIIIIVIIGMSYLACKNPKEEEIPAPQQKPLALAYDGDVDM
ncbi:thrombospondin type-1 domain-containing protein 7B [Protopterus annectens]|uniref:thrombospondin type-1 domain-containing protein 7B n=1 Tax=Protopterus annectens TaxID=7888 RepID=UPI001CFB2363|nr:thrombospondin type-1 domain-containing protein 7B [Protopterus annectens]